MSIIKKTINITLLFIMPFSHSMFGQLKNVLVEKYYLSDSLDATDDSGGNLEVGSITYRVFIELEQGSKLKKIFGKENHPLVFSSTKSFFNHKEEGVSFAKDLNKNRYENGTVALDTWLTIGQCSKTSSTGFAYGVMKIDDTDGSFIGGVNNDGGSEEIEGGLLNNTNASIGLPLTTVDGFISSKDQLTSSWFELGFIDNISGNENTIFGESEDLIFESINCELSNAGISGVLADKNKIIVAQLSTKGELTFSINIEVDVLENSENKTIRYYSNDLLLGANEIFSPLLKYPQLCGCKDAEYLEADLSFACEDNSKCKTKIVLGCTDPFACNYNPMANYNVENLCCYPGYCNDRDIEIICPDLPMREINIIDINLNPNPATDILNITVSKEIYSSLEVSITDVYGRKVLNQFLTFPYTINVDNLPAGIYYFQSKLDNNFISKRFIKL